MHETRYCYRLLATARKGRNSPGPTLPSPFVVCRLDRIAQSFVIPILRAYARLPARSTALCFSFSSSASSSTSSSALGAFPSFDCSACPVPHPPQTAFLCLFFLQFSQPLPSAIRPTTPPPPPPTATPAWPTPCTHYAPSCTQHNALCRSCILLYIHNLSRSHHASCCPAHPPLQPAPPHPHLPPPGDTAVHR